MINKIIKAIDNINISYKSTKKIIDEDKELFLSLKPKQDNDFINDDDYSNFEDILVVLNRTLHFENLFNYHSAVKFLINKIYLNKLNPTIDDKKQLQQALIRLYAKMYDVYEKKVRTQDGWFYDESGIIQGSLSKMKKSIENMFTKYVIHLPHSGVEIPSKYRDDYFLNDIELQQNIEQYADYKTNKLYRSLIQKHDSVINPYSRLFMDPERFFDDEKESMQINYGLGWFYENAILEKKPLRNTKHKDEIAKYYKQHHEKLTNLVEEKLEMFGECTIIDCHSFSNERYWFHDKKLELPDMCIGYDDFHKDDELVNKLLARFERYNLTINTPYSGSIVPSKYYLKDSRVKSVMIEFNKKLYLDDDNATVTNRFIPFQALLNID